MARMHAAALAAEGSPAEADASRKRAGWAAAGSILGAIGASSCCILPLLLFSFGAGGAWMGNLTALAPYQPIIVMITMGLLAYGFRAVYRKPQGECAGGAACARPLPNRIVKSALWLATALVVAAVVFPLVAPWLLGVE